MLGLTLREEFRGKRLKGTAIELANDDNTGATQVGAESFLNITYPTLDLLKGIEAIGPEQGRPVVVIGERGLGKSHLMAALHHTVTSPAATGTWLNSWAGTLARPELGILPLRPEMHVIGESLHRQRYKYLWDVLFDRHPYGEYIKGKWAGLKTEIPSDKLVTELLENRPTMLLLDEFQTWFDGLIDTKQQPNKQWAFNFIQILSEIAKNRPELLVLVVSVRNGATDAYKQIHRVNPIAIDFQAGGNAERMQQDRRRMLLHRLFENRLQISTSDIEALVAKHIAEYFRLCDIPASEQERRKKEFLECWPYAPHLLRLLEEQVLVATDAQETRDLIRILANLFKSRGDQVPLLTAADFRLDDDASGIGALLDSVANEHHRTLRKKAQQNIISVTEAVENAERNLSHLHDIVGALWLRSIAVANQAGADPHQLQADVTRATAIDDNAFGVELSAIVENSFNIHQDGNRLVFREEENPQAKLMAFARNDKMFVNGDDAKYLAKEVRYSIGGAADLTSTARIIVLPPAWSTDPWNGIEETDKPEKWDERLPIVVLPEAPDTINERLGKWLKEHLQDRRNTVRFLLPRNGSKNAFNDRDLVVLARASLKAQEWSGQNPEYRKLHSKYQGELREMLKKRFDRFAILQRFNFAEPRQSVFSVEQLQKQGAQIPAAIEEAMINDLFVPEDFEKLVMAAASEGATLGKLLRDLREPRPSGMDCVPWLGETAMKEKLLRICARGKIAINVRGTELVQTQPGEDEDVAWKRIRPKLPYTGRQLDEINIILPSAGPTTGGSAAPVGSESEGNVAGDDSNTQPVNPPQASGGSIFNPQGAGGGSRVRTPLSNPATSALNLIGKIENWGIGPATKVAEVNIKVSTATGAQLKEILRKLPDGLTFELNLEKEEG